MGTHYETLGVSPEAEDVVIDAAFRALMKRYHPDTKRREEAGDDGRAKEINEAYRVLKDPELRANYDRKLDNERFRSARTNWQGDQQSGGPEAAGILTAENRPASDLVSLLFMALAGVVMVGGVGSLTLRNAVSGAEVPAASSLASPSTQVVDVSSASPPDSAMVAPSSEQQSDAPVSAPESEGPAQSDEPGQSDGPGQNVSAETQQQALDLASITPETQPALNTAIAHALNTGAPTPWQSADASIFGLVRVSPAAFNGRQICRTIRFTVSRGSQTLTAPDQVACMLPDHPWTRRHPVATPPPGSNSSLPPF